MNQSPILQKENKMGVMSENKLLLSISIPIMLSMLIQALYNFVDSIFVARFSEDAFTAVSLTFPIQIFMIAVGIGTGIGINALLSRSLGEKDYITANKSANIGVFITFVSALVFTVIGLLFSRTYFASQVDVPEIINYGRDYMFYNCVFSFGLFGQLLFSRLLQSTGQSVLSMILQLVGTIINLILDPIFIFGLFGVPTMGVKGAAIATVISQVISMFFGIYLNNKYNVEIKLSLKQMKPDVDIIKRIYLVAFPSIIMQTVVSVMALAFNNILLTFTETAVNVFGIYFKVQGFFFMPVFGLNSGIVSIVAYNYGAKKPDRIIKTVKLALIYASGILFVGFLVFQFVPHYLLYIFDSSDEVLEIGVTAFRYISLCFLFGGFTITVTSFFQALGKGFLSMFISIIRQFVLIIPMAYFLSLTGNVDLVWLAFPISEFFAAGLAAIALHRVYHQVIIPLKEDLLASSS